jgi:hypothetical protein
VGTLLRQRRQLASLKRKASAEAEPQPPSVPPMVPPV